MAKGLVGDERERDVGMYATYRQRMKRVREKQVRKREREGGRGKEIGGWARSFRRRYNIAYANSLWT